MISATLHLEDREFMVEPYRHLRDLRTTLLMRARIGVAGEQAVSKADACAAALTEARRLIVARAERRLVGEHLAQAGALLDDLDELVLVLAHDEDRAVFAQFALLRATLNAMNGYWRRTP